MSDKTPYWYPRLTNTEWCDRIRKDYPKAALWDDETIRDEYANGWKYADMWDHLGDARGDYEKLADAYLSLRLAVQGYMGAIHDVLKDNQPQNREAFIRAGERLSAVHDNYEVLV